MWSKDLPGAIPLDLPVDATLMEDDLAAVERRTWPPEAPFRFDGFFGSETKVFHNGDWVGLSLRSQGGTTDRTDPGGPGLEDFSDTELMQLTPNIADLLRRLRAPIRSVRLLRLPPGGTIAEHRDTYHGFEYGQLRLHVPVRTNADVHMRIRGEDWQWKAGEIWYGDFGSPHSVENAGASARVHLVIDALVTPELLALCAASSAEMAVDVHALLHEEAIKVPVETLRALTCRFRVPSTLVRGIFDVDDGIVGQMDASFKLDGERLMWTLDGRDIVALQPLPRQRLGLTGWTLERYFDYKLDAHGISNLELVLQCGREQTRIAFPLWERDR